MKITKVEAIELRLPESDLTGYDKLASPAGNTLIVKIHTDDGIVGYGDVDSHARVAKASDQPVRLGCLQEPIGLGELADLDVAIRRLVRRHVVGIARFSRSHSCAAASLSQSLCHGTTLLPRVLRQGNPVP